MIWFFVPGQLGRGIVALRTRWHAYLCCTVRPRHGTGANGRNLKTHSVSVHGWSVHVHEWCLYSIHVRVRTVPENTCCLYRQRDRPFFFWPVILNFFSSKNSPFLCGRSRQSTRCSSPLHINCKRNPMTTNPFLFVIVWRSASGSGAFVGLQGGRSWILFRRRSSSSTTPSVPSRWFRTLGSTTSPSTRFFFSLLPTLSSSLLTATRAVSSGLEEIKGVRGWFLLWSASGWS